MLSGEKRKKVEEKEEVKVLQAAPTQLWISL